MCQQEQRGNNEPGAAEKEPSLGKLSVEVSTSAERKQQPGDGVAQPGFGDE